MELTKSVFANSIIVSFLVIITTTIVINVINRIKTMTTGILKEKEEKLYEKEKKIQEDQKRKELLLCKEICKKNKKNQNAYFNNNISPIINEFCRYLKALP